jgi:hypothetical protein
MFEQAAAGDSQSPMPGVVEIGGGILTFIPWTAYSGLAILACTMAFASLIWIFVMRQPADAIVTTAFFIGLADFWLTRVRYFFGSPNVMVDSPLYLW